MEPRVDMIERDDRISDLVEAEGFNVVKKPVERRILSRPGLMFFAQRSPSQRACGRDNLAGGCETHLRLAGVDRQRLRWRNSPELHRL